MNQLNPKTNQIYDDYEFTNQVLGQGVSGKVFVAIEKKTNLKFAIKVFD